MYKFGTKMNRMGTAFGSTIDEHFVHYCCFVKIQYKILRIKTLIIDNEASVLFEIDIIINFLNWSC